MEIICTVFGGTPKSQHKPLGRCQGDCDSDSDCEGRLRCHQRDGTSLIPGCQGTGVNDYDYCVDVCDLGRRKRQGLQLHKPSKVLQLRKSRKTVRGCIDYFGCYNSNTGVVTYGDYRFEFDCNIGSDYQHTNSRIQVRFFTPDGTFFGGNDHDGIPRQQCEYSNSVNQISSVSGSNYHGPLGYVRVRILGDDAFFIDKAWTCDETGLDGCVVHGANGGGSWCLSTDSGDGSSNRPCYAERYFVHTRSCCGNTVWNADTTKRQNQCV